MKHLWIAALTALLIGCAPAPVSPTPTLYVIPTVRPTQAPFVFPTVADTFTPRPTRTPAPTATPTLTATATSTPTPTDVLTGLEAAIREVLGNSNRDIERVSYFGYEPNYLIGVRFAVQDSFDTDGRAYSAKSDTLDILEKVAATSLVYERIEIEGTFILIDDFGNTHEDRVFHVVYYPATVAKINWENKWLIVDNAWKIADEVLFLHPEFIPYFEG